MPIQNIVNFSDSMIADKPEKKERPKSGKRPKSSKKKKPAVERIDVEEKQARPHPEIEPKETPLEQIFPKAKGLLK